MSSTDIEFKSSAGTFNVDQAQGIVECFVAGIGNKDSVGDVLIPGAFKESLKRRKPRVVWGHNWNDPIGKVLEIYEVSPSDTRLPMKMKAAGIGGLYARVQFNLNSEKGKEAFANVSFFGEEQEWSIGYKTLLASFDQNLQANILKEVELYEVSPVLHGANQLTGTISVKSDESEEKCPPGGMPGMGQPGMGQPGMNRPMQPGKPRIPSMPENPLMVSLRRELVQRSGSNVIIRSMTENMAIFDRITSDGLTSTYRIPYHFSGDSFMFGKPERVSALVEDSNPAPTPPQTPRMPQAVTYGNSGPDFTTIASAPQDEEKTLEDEITDFLLDGIEEKVGRTINTRNLGKLKNVVQLLQDIISTSEKEVEVKSELLIEIEPEKAFAAKSLLDPIMDYHRVESHVSTKGIVITSGVTPEFIDAVETMQKSLGARIGRRVGSTGGGGATGKVRGAGRALTGTFDPNAVDADGDKLVQEGTAFERPATPNVAKGPKKIERGLRSGNAEVISKDELPKELVNDIANAAVRAVGRNGDETRLIDGAKEVLANLTNEKLKDSVGTSVSNARKRLAEMLSDEKVIEEFESKRAIEDFMDEVGYAVDKMIDSHVSSVKKTGTSIEKEEIEEIADNAKTKFQDDFNKLIGASKEFWGKRRKPGRLDKTPEEAKKTAAEDRKYLMESLRAGGEPEDLEATLSSITKLFVDSSEGITSGTISLEDLNYEIEKAIDQIVENDPSIDPEELVNEFGDALREGASKDGANPLIVALAKEFGDEKITGGDLIDYLNDTRQSSVYRADRGKIEKENIRGLASRRGEGTMLGRPGQIQRDERGNINSPDAANMRKEHDAKIFSKLRELGFNDDEIEALTGVPNGGREHPASEKVGLSSKSIRPDSGVKKYSLRLLEEKRDSLNDNPSVGVDRKQLDGAWADQVITDLNDGKVDPIDMMGVMQVLMDDISEKLRSPEKDTNAIEERQKLGKKIRRLLVNNMTDDEKSSSGKFSSSPKPVSGLASRTAVGGADDGKPRKFELTLSSDERGELLNELPIIRRHAKDEAALNVIEKKLRDAKNGKISLTQEENDSIQQAIYDAIDASVKKGKRETIVTSDLLGVLDMASESDDGKFISPNFMDEQNGRRGNTGLRSGLPNNGAPSDMPPNQQRWLIDWAMRNPNLVVGQKILKKHKEGNGQMKASDWTALRSLHKNVTGGRGLRSGRDDANDRPDMTPTGEGGGPSTARRTVANVRGMGQLVGEEVSSDSVQAGRGRPMGSGGGIGDSRLKGRRFDDVKPKDWDSMSVDDQYEWLLNDGSRSRSGMSRAAFDGVMNDILLREEKEQAQAERAARRAERASTPAKPVDQATEAVAAAAEKPIKVKPRPDNPDAALVERKKDLSTTKKFTDRIADRAVASNNKEKSDDIHREAWEEIASIMDTEDLTKSQIKEAIDRVDKYLKEAATSDDESDDSFAFQDQGEKLKETLQKLQKYYSKDEFISETPPKPEPKAVKDTDVTPPESYSAYISAREAVPSGGLRSGKAGRTEIKEEATFFKDVVDSLPKEIQAARNNGDRGTADALSMLQTIINRQEAAKLGDRRTNAGRILMTQKEIDDVLDALMISLDRQVELNSEKRQVMFAKLIDMMAKAAMGTFIDKTTEELQGRTTTRRSASGRTVNIQDL